MSNDSDEDCEVVVPRAPSEFGCRIETKTPRIYYDLESPVTTPSVQDHHWATPRSQVPDSHPDLLVIDATNPTMRVTYKGFSKQKRAKSSSAIRRPNTRPDGPSQQEKMDPQKPLDEDTNYALRHRGFHRPSKFVIARYPSKFHGIKGNLTDGPVGTSNHKLPPSFKPKTRYGKQAIVVTPKDRKAYKHWPTPPLYPSKPKMKDASCDCQIMEWHEKAEKEIQVSVQVKNKLIQCGNPTSDVATQYPRIRQKDASVSPMEIKLKDQGIQNVPETKDAMEDTSVSIMYYPDPVVSVCEAACQTSTIIEYESQPLSNEKAQEEYVEYDEYIEPNLQWETPVYDEEEFVPKPSPPPPDPEPTRYPYNKKEASPFREIQFPIDTRYPVQPVTRVMFNDRVDIYNESSGEESEYEDDGQKVIKDKNRDDSEVNDIHKLSLYDNGNSYIQ